MPGRKPKICITKECSKPVKARGLCSRCLEAARKRVIAKKVTDEQLVQLGMILPAYKMPFDKQLDKALAKR